MILIMHQTVAIHDAIGNDIDKMFHILSENNKCMVYADNKFNPNIDYLDDNDLDSLLQDEKSIIIYHHSVYWEKGEEILKRAKGQIIFRYHNITPSHFFKEYNEFHYAQCEQGRIQTKRFIQEFPNAFWLSDSRYNTEDLEGVDSANIGICPPFHVIEQWIQTTPDEGILKKLIEEGEVNLLFVGRIAPNKGHLFLLEVLRVFILNYHSNIKLRIVGKFDDSISGYNQLIKQKIQQYHLQNNIEFIGEINDATLASYYLGSDLFICASEHEGFCVPILEAQSLGLPIVSLDACAVPDTGDKGQILLEKDTRKFAAAINILMNNQEYYKYMQKLGQDNFNSKYTYEIMKETFLTQMKKFVEV